MADARGLNEDLHILAKSNLEITPLNGSFNIIQQLDDEPNDVGGLSAAELKAKFDQAGVTIQSYINETLIPEVLGAESTEAQRQANETERQAKETVRQSGESTRQTNEAGRVSAESGRVSAENARAAAETARASSETARRTAESARASAETERTRAEGVRAAAERARAGAEAERAAEEGGRQTAESTRAAAETAREASESTRQSNETLRQAAEEVREAEQAQFMNNVTATVQLLGKDDGPTVAAVPENGSFRLDFGIPQGGRNGKSAYQYAVAGGYTGTEAEFQALMGSGPWLSKTVGEFGCDLGGGEYAPSLILTDATIVSDKVCLHEALLLQNQQIKGVAAPTHGYDAANMEYVVSMLPKEFFVVIAPSDWTDKTYRFYTQNAGRILYGAYATGKNTFFAPSFESVGIISQCNVRVNSFGFSSFNAWFDFACDTTPASTVMFHGIIGPNA